MQRERQRLAGLKGILAYDWTPDGKAILVPLDGDLYLASLDGSVKRLTNSKESELNPEVSPKGKYVSFVRAQQLWAGPLIGTEHAITPGGGTVHYGEAEFVAQEEFDRPKGYWWSPDDRRIAVEWFDESNVGVVTRTSIGAEGTTVFDQRYPAAGTANIVPHLIVIDPNGKARVTVDLGPDKDVYLARVDWAPDGKTLYIQRINRTQDRLDVLAADPATGKSRILFREQAAPGQPPTLSGVPALDDSGRPARRSRRYNRLKIFNYDNNIENSIVNNIKGRYHLKKGVKYHLKKRAGSLYRDRAKGETA